MSENKEIKKVELNNSVTDFARYLQTFEDLAKCVENTSHADSFRDKDNAVNRQLIIANMVFGHELGLTPMVSVSYGKRLNYQSYQCIKRGKALGLDEVSSMTKLFFIANREGSENLYVHVDVINKVLIEAGILKRIVEDYVPIYAYFTLQGNTKLDDDIVLDKEGKLLNSFFLVDMTLLKATSNKAYIDLVKTKREEGFTPVYRKEVNRRTSIEFKNTKTDETATISFSTQEAINAKLKAGFHSEFVNEKNEPLYIEGKDNWNKYPRQMLINRCIAIGGRFMAANKLYGVYELSSEIENSDPIEVVDIPTTEV